MMLSEKEKVKNLGLRAPMSMQTLYLSWCSMRMLSNHVSLPEWWSLHTQTCEHNYWIKLDNFAIATSHNDLWNLLQDLLYGESDTVLKMMIFMLLWFIVNETVVQGISIHIGTIVSLRNGMLLKWFCDNQW